MDNKTRLKKWREANPSKVKEQRKRTWNNIKSNHSRLLEKRRKQNMWHHSTKAKRTEKLLAQSRKSYKQNPAYWRAYALRKRFNLSVSEYQEVHDAQNGLCAICHKPEVDLSKLGKVKFLTVDHCHVTGAVRGLLCRKCNAGLGMFSESSEMLRKAAEYLERSTLNNGG